MNAVKKPVQQPAQATLPTFAERRAALVTRGRKPRQAPKPRWLTKHDLVGVPFVFHSITMQDGKYGTEAWVIVEREGHDGEREGLYLSGARIVPVLEDFTTDDFAEVWTLVQRGTTSSGLPILEMEPAPLDSPEEVGA